MNKKKLSVVMAGAMLASSVAPVLAATVEKTELDQNELGSLVVKVYDKLTTGERFDKDERGSTDAGFTSETTLAGRSVYYVVIKGADGNSTSTQKADMKKIYEATEKGKEAELKDALQEAFKVLTAGDVVEIHSFGFRKDDDGKIVSTAVATKKVYEDSDFAGAVAVGTPSEGTGARGTLQNLLSKEIYKNLTNQTGDYDGSLTGNKNANLIDDKNSVRVVGNTIEIYFKDAIKNVPGTVEVTLKDDAGKLANGTYNKLVIKPSDAKLNFNKVYASKGASSATNLDENTNNASLYGFEEQGYNTAGPLPNEKLEEITITGVENNFTTEDLYDGLMLTTKGHDILSLVKKYRNDKNAKTDAVITNLAGTVTYPKDRAITLEANAKNEIGFKVVIKNAKGNTAEVYTVKGEKAATNTLVNWLNDELAKVDILAGATRYETAVSVAREQLKLPKGYLGENDTTNNPEVSNIVLVNGRSLVDGLATAPLAAHLTANSNDDVAPVLLTEADELPKATREFLKELLAKKVIGNVNTTIHLVGGTSVLSRDLEKELRDYGFKIERYNGANREETSLEVAEAIKPGGLTDAFVVGANGEADAMSIAPVAAHGETPIIVAKNGGISYNALDELDGVNVTVIGGETALSKEDYETIEEYVGETGSVERIAGENRQATNADIIKKYYKEQGSGAGTNGIVAESVIVSKDGRGNKDELVDALTVANLAVQKKAPIILTKSSLSKEQMDAINLRAKSSKSLYQVGEGVERSVMETLAKALGLSNLK